MNSVFDVAKCTVLLSTSSRIEVSDITPLSILDFLQEAFRIPVLIKAMARACSHLEYQFATSQPEMVVRVSTNRAIFHSAGVGFIKTRDRSRKERTEQFGGEQDKIVNN